MSLLFPVCATYFKIINFSVAVFKTNGKRWGMKTFQTLLAAIPLVLVPYSIFGQDHDAFDIGAYQPPDYTYQELIVIPAIAINNTDSSYNNTGILASEKRTSLYSGSRYSLYPSHRFHLYSKRLEFGSYNFINSRYEASPWSKKETDDVLSDDRFFTGNHAASATFQSIDSAKLYYPSGAFIGALAGVGVAIENSNLNSGSSRQLKSDTATRISYFKSSSTSEFYSPSFSLFLGCGWGRIRDVTFGAVALNMLDRIHEVLPQSAGISAEGVQNFATFIEKRRRRRAFDGRLAFIAHIDTLSQYLADTRAITGPSSAITMELADQWLYAFTQNRQAGLAFSLYPGITIDYLNNRSSNTAYSWRDTLNYDLQLIDADVGNARRGQLYREESNRINQYQTEFNYRINSTIQMAKPINRFFQINGQVDVNFYWNHYFDRSIPSDQSETDYETLLPVFEADASCMFAYYPDTRTTFSFVPDVSYNRSFNYLINKNKLHGTEMTIVKHDLHNDFRGVNLAFPLNIIYYASPRLQYRITASTVLRSYYSSEQSVSKAWYSTSEINIGLTYQLF
jgi:hypothetical protein